VSEQFLTDWGEQILTDDLPSGDQLELNSIPIPDPMSGVYFLYSGGDLLYIGSTTHLFRRLHEHRYSIPLLDAYAFIPAGKIWMHELEAFYILLLKPPFNTVMPRTPGLRLWRHRSAQ
jgi:hypothetical protein